MGVSCETFGPLGMPTHRVVGGKAGPGTVVAGAEVPRFLIPPSPEFWPTACLWPKNEHMFDYVDRCHELEAIRRSIAMAPPGSPALDREEAMRLLAELQDLAARLRALRDALRAVIEE